MDGTTGWLVTFSLVAFLALVVNLWPRPGRVRTPRGARRFFNNPGPRPRYRYGKHLKRNQYFVECTHDNPWDWRVVRTGVVEGLRVNGPLVPGDILYFDTQDDALDFIYWELEQWKDNWASYTGRPRKSKNHIRGTSRFQ